MIRVSTPALAAALLFVVAATGAGAAPRKHAAKPVPASDSAASAEKPAAEAKKPAGAVPLLPGSGSKEPVNITADKLDFLNKENKLIYSGNVEVVQGDSTMKAAVLYIDLEKTDASAPGATAPSGGPAASAAGPGQNSVKHMEADGPVTLISKDQIGTGDHATYDKAENKVYLNGNVTLSQTPAGSDKPNVTQGDHLVYDMTSGEAQVFSGATNGGRVTSVFTPGSSAPGDGAKPAAPEPKKSQPRKAARKPAAAHSAPKSEAEVE